MAQNFTDILNRIKKILSTDKDQDVANAINVSINAFSNRKRTNSIPYSEFVQLAQKKNVSLNWLFHGTGPIYNDTEKQTEHPDNQNISNWRHSTIDHSDLVKRFQDKQTGKEFNEILLELEKQSLKEYYSLLGYAKRTLTELTQAKKQSNHEAILEDPSDV